MARRLLRFSSVWHGALSELVQAWIGSQSFIALLPARERNELLAELKLLVDADEYGAPLRTNSTGHGATAVTASITEARRANPQDR